MRFSRMRRPLGRSVVIVAVALLALVSVSAAFAAEGQPVAITKEADKMHNLYLFVVGMAIFVFVLVESALIFAIIRFRRKNDELPPQTHGSTLIEFLWTGIPVVIVIALFTYSYIVLRDVEHNEELRYDSSGAPVLDPTTHEQLHKNLTIEVEAFQWQWSFHYKMNEMGPNSDPNNTGTFAVTGTAAKDPTLVIPVGEPVEFTLKADDVIHSFYVRNFLYKLDVIPGRDNKFTVTPNKTGDYIGQCAELCGLNHALMRFNVQVVDRATFDKWVADQAAATKVAQQP